ncbi:MAG: hypothetical protein Q7Q71_04655 [Verrucomicrobiota bacterium JB023]|nr:hypothetical protein [Verrucomicrobiota bacterium JB023]
MNARWLLRDFTRERRLQRAMTIRAKGVPGEDQQWLRVKPLLDGFNFLFASLFSLWLGLVLLSIPQSWTSEKADFFIFAVSLFVGGYLSDWVGRGIIIPRDGFVLAPMPIGRRKVWWHSLSGIPWLLVAAYALACFFFAKEGGEYMVRALGWMTVPFVAVTWQLYRWGTAGDWLKKAGVLLGVALVLESLVRHVLSFNQIEPYYARWHGALPHRWLDQGWVGWLVPLFLTILTIILWERRQRLYSWRALLPALESRPKGGEEVSVADEKADQLVVATNDSHPVKRSKPCFLWNAQERELANLLVYQKDERVVWRILGAFLALVPLYYVVGMPVLIENGLVGLASFPALALLMVLLRGSQKSGVKNMAFRDFSLPGGKRVSALGAFPISEKTLFVMFLKEAFVDVVLHLPPRLALLAFAHQCIYSTSFFGEWAGKAALAICYFELNRWIWMWSSQLWGNVERFHSGLDGWLKKELSKTFYRVSLILLTLAIVVGLGMHYLGIEVGGWFPLVITFHIVLTLGGLTYLRWTYHQGRGSLVTAIPKKSRSFSLTRN